METTSQSEFIEQSVALLKSARHTVALTGAGISTPSGIPDFRSRGSGLWERNDPMAVASIFAFRYKPERFYEWVMPLAELIIKAKPNPAHVALASLEKAGFLAGIVTQNIDDLHQQAGSDKVVEIHGHLRQATCTECLQTSPTEDLLETFVEEKRSPICQSCGGVLKPDVVLFGEELPYQAVVEARDLFDKSDLIIIAGSSLEVSPVATMPVSPLNQGAKLILINNQPTYLDERASTISRVDVATILPSLVDKLLGGSKKAA